MAATPQNTPQFTGGGTVFSRNAPQWNQYFASKVDAEAGTADNLNLTGTPTINGMPMGVFPLVNVISAPLFLTNGTLLLGYDGNFAINGSGLLTLTTPSELGFEVVASIAALRANTTAWPSILVQGYYGINTPGGGVFDYVATDVTSADNGGTIIVDAAGHRYYLQLAGGVINSQSFGTYGDNSHDDTTALQNAITYAFANGLDLYTPASTQCYKITATLTVPNSTGFNLKQGWSWRGDGPGEVGAGGTVILLYGTGFTSIFQMGSAAWRRCLVQGIAFQTNTVRGATYGILFNSSEFSANALERVYIGPKSGALCGPAKCIGVLAGTGANGEFNVYRDCVLGPADVVFYTEEGQGFQHRFDHCQYSTTAGGTAFDLNYTNGGFGLVVTDCNGTMAQSSGIANSLLLNDNYNTSTVIFIGGRLENITQVYKNAGATIAAGGGTVKFQSLELGMDYDHTNGALTLVGAVSMGFSATSVEFDNCSIFANSANCTFPINIINDAQNWDVAFRRCHFTQFAQPPYPLGAYTDINFRLLFDDCRVTTSGVFNSTRNRLTAFNREFGSINLGNNKRSLYDDTAWAQAGTPEQQIVNPQLSNINGGAVVPLSPWALTGISTIYCEDYNGVAMANPSPFARTIRIGNGGTLSQTIAAIDLSSLTYAQFNENGANFSYLTWEIMAHQVGSNDNYGNTCTFSIIDSVSGEHYADVLYAATGEKTGPIHIVLSRAVLQQGGVSHPIISIQNTGPGTTQIVLDWWAFSYNAKPAMNPVMATPGIYAQDWAVVAQDALFWSRMALPYKSDAYGSAATTPLGNLISDAYISSTDNTLTWYNGVGWNKISGSGAGAAASYQIPVSGFSITLSARRTILVPAGTLATGTIVLPASPVADQVLTVCSTQQVTALTVTPGFGQTVASAPSFLAQDTPVSFIYDMGVATWYPT